MDINATIAALKARPDFADHVGMILIHNGTVRSWSRADKKAVTAVEVIVDHERIDQLRREFLQHQGIYDIIIETRDGLRRSGDDLLYIVVAGDIREHVKEVLARLLDRIKAEAVSKRELTGLP
jgi:molybdopterin synthase catalytic subunit